MTELASKSMQEFKVIPHEGIGPAQLAMTRDQIREALGEPSHVQSAHEKWGIQFPDKDFFYRNAFQVSYDSEMRAEFIEVTSEADYVVTFDGLDVHRAPPADVIAAIERHGELDRTEREYPVNLWFPDLHLNLYREHSEEDNFDTIGISTPEYKTETEG